ncbi:DUF4445 domain-containing protein [Candidatus Magnetomoraceae bacterium gMMP-15]
MNEHKVVFLPYNKEIIVKDGDNLIRAAMEAGIHINASCGGEGICGKCRVIIEDGEVEGGISERLSKEDQDKGYRLACMSFVKSDLTIRIPVESDIDTSVLSRKTGPRHRARIQEMDLNTLKEKGLFIPPVEKRYIEVPEPNREDNVCDASRLVNALRDIYDEHNLEVELPVITKLPDILRQDEFRVSFAIFRPLHEGHRSRIINVMPGHSADRNYALAIDVGTTTIYGQLLDTITGEVMASYGEFNGQISYGEDVISRIVFTDKGDGLKKLQSVVIETINKIIRKNIKRAKIDPEEISTITLAGNTTMTQLMLGINPKYLRLSPYVPASTFFPPFKGIDIGFELPPHVVAMVYACVSSYVGGDIVSGVMGSGMYQTDELTLFIDIGTNAEIVIGNKDWMACAACSAGPAFEGGGVEHGMRASKGAIEDFSIDPVTLEPMNMTIGNIRPKGICGSGLITIAATLFEAGVIDRQGKFDRNLDTPRIRKRNNLYEYVLAWKDETQIDRDIVITEADIDNLIRAKGAMYAGYMTLLNEVGLSIESIEKIILAGGFGSYVDLEKAMTIGLLPEIDPEKVTYVGNGSLMGAKMSCLTNQIRKDVVQVVSKITNFEFSETVSYMDNYVASLFLPHTDINLFPKLKERLEAFNSK